MDIKNQFPIFKNNPNLIYFDNASTTQKPQCVIDAMVDFYSTCNANVHRGAYQIAEQATAQFENSRQVIANFINAKQNEIIFTKGTTESINLIAYSLQSTLQPGDEIIISEMEHHSNIIPWQMLQKNNISIKYAPINNQGEIDMKQLEALITNNTKLISIIHMSNVLGTINSIEQIIKLAKQNNILTLIDAAQSISHEQINVQELGCDFLVFSGHKIMGPTGVGVLYMNEQHADIMEPFLRGGQMIKEVTKTNTTWNDSPWKFEAGTPNIAQVIGLSKSVEYVNELGLDNIKKYEQKLLTYLLSNLKDIHDINILAHHNNSGPIVSFNIKGCHPYDITKLLDGKEICIRAGHHCAQILMESLKINYTNRVSLFIYNSKEEIDYFINHLLKVITILK